MKRYRCTTCGSVFSEDELKDLVLVQVSRGGPALYRTKDWKLTHQLKRLRGEVEAPATAKVNTVS